MSKLDEFNAYLNSRASSGATINGRGPGGPNGPGTAPGTASTAPGGPPVLAGPASTGETTERGGVCVADEDDLEPKVCEMSESDRAAMEEENKKSAALQRARDLGFQDGHAGREPNVGEMKDWPEAQLAIPGVPTPAIGPLYAKLIESYQAGFNAGKAERAKDTVAQKLKMTPTHFADDRGKQQLDSAIQAYQKGFADGEANKPAKPPQSDVAQPGQSDVIEAYNVGYKTGKEETPKAYNYGFEDGASGGQQAQRGKVPQDGPEAPQLRASYDRGFRDGQAALMRVANDGFKDGQADSSAATDLISAKQMAELAAKHLASKKEILQSHWSKQLMNAYVSGYGKAWKEFAQKLIEITNKSRNQPQMSPNTMTEGQIEEGRRINEAHERLKHLQDEGWMDELHKELKDHPPHEEHDHKSPYEPPEIEPPSIQFGD
jgi:hypothetical protein